MKNYSKLCEICGNTFTRRSQSQSWRQLEVRRFCSNKCRGAWVSIENKRNGKVPPSAKGKVMKDSQKMRLSIANTRAYSDPTRRLEISKRMIGRPQYHHRGPLNVNWKGGITPINAVVRTSLEYKNWRRAVFQRDDYTCQDCGDRGVKLHADHIKPFAYFINSRFDINNGQTLCVDCHKKTPTFAGKAITLYGRK